MSEQTTQVSGQRGIALMTVLTTLAVLTILATDLQYNARIDATLAENARDELIAYYNAKAALEIELGILRAVRQAQATLKQFLPGLPLPNLIDMVPTECGLVSQLMTTSDEQPLPLQGECNAKAEMEQGKIDVNGFAGLSSKFQTRDLLLGRLMDPKFEPYFEQENSAGERVLRDELVGYIGDFIDSDVVREGSASSDEDDVYSRKSDRYKAKNAAFDSTAEIGLVYGIDDEFYEELLKSVTIYPAGPVVLGNADLATIAAIIRQAAVNPGDPGLVGAPMVAVLTQITEMKKIPLGGALLNKKTLSDLAKTVGLLLDEAKLGRLTSDNPDMNWVTIRAVGQSNTVEKRLVATFNLSINEMVYYQEE